MRKSINILLIAMLLVSISLTPIVASGATLSDWTNQGYVKVAGDILPPEIIGSVWHTVPGTGTILTIRYNL